jgi:hypothetical protein
MQKGQPPLGLFGKTLKRFDPLPGRKLLRALVLKDWIMNNYDELYAVRQAYNANLIKKQSRLNAGPYGR